MDLAFRDIKYQVPVGIPSPFTTRVRKRILDNVSGEFRSGELTAIMGPSGAGKSTLMNILAGYTKTGYKGEVLVNGTAREVTTFHRLSCYIMQDDQLHPLLTVKEIMTIAASLKLNPSTNTNNVKHIKVMKILDNLGLSSTANTLTRKLSGGQRKRLSVALELIHNPPIMFFDEPTSGLDSSSSKQCISLLKKLAQEGRVVVCTLHQPSALILDMVDHLYCVSGGKCFYSGSPALVTRFLSGHDLHCPQYHNPADFLLEVCCGEYGTQHNDRLIKTIQNGNNTEWRQDNTVWDQIILSSQNGCENSTPVYEAPLIPVDIMEVGQQEQDLTKYPITFMMQVLILIKRAFIIVSRDRFLTHCRLLMHLIIGLLMGTFYFNIGNDATFVFDNFSLLFFAAIFLAFSASSAVVVSFPLEVPIIRRETFNHWYSVKSYFIATCVSDAPVQLMCSGVFSIVVYWMSNQPREWDRFFLFLLMCLITSLLAQSLGYLVGACLRVQHGVIFGPLALMPWVILAGYFLHMSDAPSWMQWLFRASYLRYSLEGLMIAVYGFSRRPLACSDDYCHYIFPSKFLKELDMNPSNFILDTSVLFGLFFTTRIITYFILVYQLCHKQKT